jgi:glycosyltransferase involved in cell wall biosynthesis
MSPWLKQPSMESTENTHLALFFTDGVALRTWDNVGSLDRELALYWKLQQFGVRISLVTYGDRSDLDYSESLRGITVLCNKWSLKPLTYRSLLPILHGPSLRKCNVIKTNQTRGSDNALRAARLWRKPLVARCGYMWSCGEILDNGPGSPEAENALRVEKNVFPSADRVVVTTEAMRRYVVEKIGAPESSLRVIPNYVETSKFMPDATPRIADSLIYVGRLSKEKNVEALLEAVAPLKVTLTLIGDGPLGSKLRERFATLGGRVKWLDRVAHAQLPSYLTSSSLFVLPSLHEGHPKALIEAMSCGLPVLGGDSPGINDLIKHGANGYLCATDHLSIRKAIQHLLSHPAQCEHLGKNAREYAVHHFSLDRIARLELSVVQEFSPSAISTLKCSPPV